MYRLLTILLCSFLFLTSCSDTKDLASAKGRNKKGAVQNEQKDMELRALFIEAQKERMLGNTYEATKKLKQCLAIDPQNHAVFYDLALIADQQSNVEQALNYSKKAVNLDPTNIWYQTLLAEIYVSEGNLDKAEEVYEQILKTHPESYDYYYDLAEVRFRKRDFAKSIEALDKVEEKIGTSDELLQQKQMLYMEIGETEKAKKELQKMIDANPRQARYYGMMAEIYRSEGNNEKALEYYQKILEFDPDNGMVQLSLYEHYKNNGESEKARMAIKKAFEDETIDIDTKVNILINYYAVTETDQGQLEEAYELAETLKMVYPQEAKSHAVYGDFLLRDGKFEEARKAFRDAVTLDPGRPAIWNQLLSLDSELKDYNGLKTDSDKALELFPTMPFYYLLNGIAHSQLGETEEAIEMLESGKELVIDDDNTLLEFYSALGEAYNNAKQYADSDKAYDRALNILPDNVFVLNNYSYYLSLRKDRLDVAEKMAARANEVSPDMASFQDTYAWVLYQAGKYEQSKEWMEKAMKNGGADSGTIIEHYGDVLFQLGDTAGALANWKKAKGLGETSEEIDRKIKDGTL